MNESKHPEFQTDRSMMHGSSEPRIPKISSKAMSASLLVNLVVCKNKREGIFNFFVLIITLLCGKKLKAPPPQYVGAGWRGVYWLSEKWPVLRDQSIHLSISKMGDRILGLV